MALRLNSMRGYFGVAIYMPKTETNVGTLIRTAHILGASWVCTIGRRYKEQASDTMKAVKHMPLFHYETYEHFLAALPSNCALIGVELDDRATLLENFTHPERACYLLGAEDTGIPAEVLSDCDSIVKLRGARSLNVAVAGSIVLYNR